MILVAGEEEWSEYGRALIELQDRARTTFPRERIWVALVSEGEEPVDESTGGFTVLVRIGRERKDFPLPDHASIETDSYPEEWGEKEVFREFRSRTAEDIRHVSLRGFARTKGR